MGLIDNTAIIVGNDQPAPPEWLDKSQFFMQDTDGHGFYLHYDNDAKLVRFTGSRLRWTDYAWSQLQLETGEWWEAFGHIIYLPVRLWLLVALQIIGFTLAAINVCVPDGYTFGLSGKPVIDAQVRTEGMA